MHKARIVHERQNECVTMYKAHLLQRNRTGALQCTERVYYKKTERVRYNAQGVYITERQKECITMYKARILQRSSVDSRNNN